MQSKIIKVSIMVLQMLYPVVQSRGIQMQRRNRKRLSSLSGAASKDDAGQAASKKLRISPCHDKEIVNGTIGPEEPKVTNVLYSCILFFFGLHACQNTKGTFVCVLSNCGGFCSFFFFFFSLIYNINVCKINYEQGKGSNFCSNSDPEKESREVRIINFDISFNYRSVVMGCCK